MRIWGVPLASGPLLYVATYCPSIWGNYLQNLANDRPPRSVKESTSWSSTGPLSLTVNRLPPPPPPPLQPLSALAAEGDDDDVDDVIAASEEEDESPTVEEEPVRGDISLTLLPQTPS